MALWLKALATKSHEVEKRTGTYKLSCNLHTFTFVYT